MAVADFPLLLGGSARPLGSTVTFLDRPLDDVREAVLDVHGESNVSSVPNLAAGLHALDPMEAPWTRELIVDCEPWTAYVNNGRGGGDPSAIAPAISRALGCRCVVAQHMQRYGPGHAATQLWILGPDGEPPLYYERTIAAHATDGRWQWHTSGSLQPFESVESYSSRRIRDRFDRELLIRYLAEVGIRADDPGFFGRGVLVQQIVDWDSFRETAAEFRQTAGWD